MADIELVIKISEEEYINIKNAINSLIENGVERASMSKVCLAILDGTPVPKGHGRLFDERDIVNGNYEVIGNRIYELEPIIEADKEEGEEMKLNEQTKEDIDRAFKALGILEEAIEQGKQKEFNQNREVHFMYCGRKFAIRELAQ